MRLADTLMGTVPEHVPHTVKTQKHETISDDGLTITRKPQDDVDGYTIQKHVMGTYVINGPGIQNHHVNQIGKTRRIIDLMAQEQQWSTT